jgi:Do/DeqQ family serine protease
MWGVIVLGLGAVVGLAIFAWAGRGTSVKHAAPLVNASAPVLATDPSVFAPVIERILPAVVSVEVEKRFRHRDLGIDEGDERDLDPGFGDQEFEVPSSGSGFVIDPEGHIVTNDHVVRDGVAIDVHFSGGSTLPARLIGRDPMTDIAVIKVDSPTPLPTVPLGNSEDMRIGDPVAAIGNPLGMLEGSVTAGIVSAKGRDEISIRGGAPQYQDFIQTDASINPGNSGGPLVNSRGEAIGVNTAYNAPGNGIGFAISINMARDVAQELIAKGRVPRAMLGVSLMELDPDLARGWGLVGTSGVVVTEVQGGSPADKAGIQEGDVIVSFDDVPAQHVSPFRLQVARTEVGRSVRLRFLHHGLPRDADVRLTEREDPVPTMPEPIHPRDSQNLGLILSSLRGDAGVQVDSVVADSPANQAGLQSGDRILEVGWEEMDRPDVVRQAVQKALNASGVAVLHVQRGEDRTFLTLRGSR